MRYKIEIKDGQDEDIVVYAKEKSDTLLAIEALLCSSEEPLVGYIGGDIVRLDVKNVYCFYTEGGRVFAECDEGKLSVRERLYRLEEQCGNDFVRINQSCLVNLSKIKKFRTSIGGSLLVILENGYRDYVSRRQLKAVKERLGL